MLRTAFYALARNAAPGVDGMTWETYEKDLDRRIEELHGKSAERSVSCAAVTTPVHSEVGRLETTARGRRAGGQDRPESGDDGAERDLRGRFPRVSYGFRPKRSQHAALDALIVGIDSRKVSWILDADIRSFFNEVSQEWLVRFVEHRIGDKRIVRLIQKWLKAGVLDEGIVVVEEKGTGQGAVISPLLANVYLHYVFDLWAHRWRRREAKGDVILVRYADDIVVGFQYESDAKAFWDAMRERLREFSLSLHEDKTRLIEFGRFAATEPREARPGQAGNL